jgi:hypothetical protein
MDYRIAQVILMKTSLKTGTRIDGLARHLGVST